MGLDTSHDCWHGPYSAFKRFRDAIREAAGIDEMAWAEELNSLVSDGNVDEDLEGQFYDWTPDDDIKYLLCHSDCDGYIWPKHALLIAERLRELIPDIDEDADNVGSIKHSATCFMNGCYRAAALGEPVVFA